MDEITVPLGLREHALPRVNEDHGQIGGRRSGDHVARVLLVARRVGDDELAFVGREETIRDIDRDALLALGGESVDEQREIDVLSLCADAFAVGFERGELVFENQFAVVEQASDQRGLAVVHRTARDEAQHRFLLMLAQIGVDVFRDEIVGAHQK